MAADMRAGGRARVQFAGRIAIGRDLAHTSPDDGAVPGFQIGYISQLARCEILGKVLHRGHILSQEVTYCGGRLARGLIDFGPFGVSSQDQRRLIIAPATPCVMPWPESPVCT